LVIDLPENAGMDIAWRASNESVPLFFEGDSIETWNGVRGFGQRTLCSKSDVLVS